jgi:YD repeat-containing protein
MKKKFIVLALTAVMTITVASAQAALCKEDVKLETLANYFDTVHTADPQVKLFYSNLINNPTHSYRIEHLDLGFNGCTGRVDEQVVMADGTRRDNVFIFNEQGLLTQSIIQGSKGVKTETNYTYSFDEVLGFTLKQSKSKNRTINYASIYGDHGRRESIKGSNGSRQDYTYNEQGHLTKRVITQSGSDKRTLLYQDGYIVREEVGGRVFRYHYDFDTATGKKFLIAIKELSGTDVIHERTFDYDIDTHGRYTRVSIALDGKHQMSITRRYSE